MLRDKRASSSNHRNSTYFPRLSHASGLVVIYPKAEPNCDNIGSGDRTLRPSITAPRKTF